MESAGWSDFSMDPCNLDAARLVRMRQNIDALLPDDDPPAREEICRLLLTRTRVNSTNLAVRMRFCFN
jgi:hypothetical protein